MTARDLGFEGLAKLSPSDQAIVDQQTAETIEGCDPTSLEPVDCSDADREMRRLFAEYGALKTLQVDESNVRLAEEAKVFAPENDA